MANTNENLQNDAFIADSDKTIFALATPGGKSGVAVLRVSGPAVKTLPDYLGITKPLMPRMAELVTIKHPKTGEWIDKALALSFPAPHSFTGEDVLEFHLHGSRAILHQMITALSDHPSCRHAEAGEFTRRAFMNEKMDLTAAEGLADLIDSESHAQQQQAIRIMQGHVGSQLELLRGRILHSLAMMEAYIDFPDEEIPESVTTQTNDEITQIQNELITILDDNAVGEKIRDGISVVIIGPPNAGKSSLLNTLAKRDVAIVSDIAGTTRDVIEVELDIDGYLVTLIDTAGLRDTAESIEEEGIRRAKEKASHADLKIAVLENIPDTEHNHDILELLTENDLLVINKSDLLSGPKTAPQSPIHPLFLSTKTSDGLTELIEALRGKMEELMVSNQTPIITRTRHREALQQCVVHLTSFLSGGPLELMTEELRLAANQIAKITGKFDVDDILDIVFSRFCIGK